MKIIVLQLVLSIVNVSCAVCDWLPKSSWLNSIICSSTVCVNTEHYTDTIIQLRHRNIELQRQLYENTRQHEEKMYRNMLLSNITTSESNIDVSDITRYDKIPPVLPAYTSLLDWEEDKRPLRDLTICFFTINFLFLTVIGYINESQRDTN